MAVVIESEIWQPHASVFAIILLACFISVTLLPHFSNHRSSISGSSQSPFDVGFGGYSASLVRFQRKFLLYYLIASVIEGLWSVFGDYEAEKLGFGRETMVLSLCSGFLVAHCFRYNLSHRQEALTGTFWFMTFSESAALIGSQILANWLAGNDSEKNILSPSTVAVFLGMINMICIARGWTDPPTKVGLQDYKKSLVAIIFGDRRIWLLSCAQASLNFSTALAWILWAPTVVADGREVHLGLMYPCFMGTRMLGSSLLPWFTMSGLSALRTEDFLLYSFIISGLVLSVMAYDYQEIGVLLVLFCIFHACTGLMLPSLARLRTMYVPNECRAAMMSMSLVPAFAALLLTIYSASFRY
ncbi:hypothetical protein AKJ16_DCAP06385 [Drosera capensis]